MYTLGIIGGLGPESTLTYYKEIVSRYRKASGKDESPHIVINSIDMSKTLALVSNEEYGLLVEYLATEIERLVSAGADFCAIASNTPHIVFHELKAKIPVPLVSIVETTAQKAKSLKLKKVLLIGTKFTMQNDFYRESFEELGIALYVPGEAEQDIIHSAIFPELEDGIVIPEKKTRLIEICSRIIKEKELDGIILGCTELPLMIHESDFKIHVLDTADIHIQALAEILAVGYSEKV